MDKNRIRLLRSSDEDILEPVDIYYDENIEKDDNTRDTFINLHYQDKHIFICRAVTKDGQIEYSIIDTDLVNKKQKVLRATLNEESFVDDEILDVEIADFIKRFKED